MKILKNFIKKEVIYSTIVLLLFLLFLELGLRTFLFFSSLGKISLQLNSYGIPNKLYGWGLKPNYSLNNYLVDTKKEELLIINSLGFRGKEFSIKKPANVIRIIAMGDSVTFGIPPENCPYSSQLQEMLEKKFPNKFEVINGGVEGYSSENVLKRLKYDVLKYQPDILLVYVGWNDLYGVNPLTASNSKRFTTLFKFLNKFYIYKAYRKIIFQWLKPQLSKIISSPQKEKEKILLQYNNFVPEKYNNNLKEIIKICRLNNIKIVLLNLASILKEEMTDEAIKKVHYPYFTSDVKALLVLQNIYNKNIEEIAKKENVPLIDLNSIFNSLPNKEDLFFDTLHLYCKGQTIIANALYEFLINSDIISFE